jgi:NADH-quinone oxidoreductase subunit M
MDQDVGSSRAINPDDYVARKPWIPRFNIDYFLGIDGISLSLVLLTALLFVLSMIPSFHIHRAEGADRFVRGYCILFLVLETGVLGSFVALDFFLFYIFWEVMLLPMYFLIGIWGGPRREYAAIKFFLYTLLGSVFILVAMLGFYFSDLRDFVSPKVAEAEYDRLVRERAATTPEKQREARRDARVSTFDMIALSRAGKAALEYLGNDRKVAAVTTAPAVNGAREQLARLAALDRAREEMDKTSDGDRRATLDNRIKDLQVDIDASANRLGTSDEMRKQL